MALRVYILGDAVTYQNYALAVERAGGIPCFGSRPADCDCLLLPGGGDMESWRYGQKNTACRDLEPERDALELELLADFRPLASRSWVYAGECRPSMCFSAAIWCRTGRGTAP